MASEKSTTAEYAYISTSTVDGPFPKFFPCNIKVISISIGTSHMSGVTTYSTAPDLVQAIKKMGKERKIPLVMLCLTEHETKRSKLARDLLEQPCAFKYTGPNTFYADKHVFTDIIFETGAT